MGSLRGCVPPLNGGTGGRNPQIRVFTHNPYSNRKIVFNIKQKPALIESGLSNLKLVKELTVDGRSHQSNWSSFASGQV
jgi:hypothetical protein